MGGAVAAVVGVVVFLCKRITEAERENKGGREKEGYN